MPCCHLVQKAMIELYAGMQAARSAAAGIDSCTGNPCGANGACTDTGSTNMYDCTCDEGYVFVNGNDCTEEDLDCSGDEFSCDLVCTSDVNHDGTVNIVGGSALSLRLSRLRHDRNSDD